MLFIKSNVMSDDRFITTDNATLSILAHEQSCIYCQTAACHCPSTQFILNCSSFVFNLPLIENCTEVIIWKTIDFSLRNLTTLDLHSLLSLRMERLLLKSNSITYIYDNIFDSLGDILIEIDLEMNQLSNLSSKWLTSKLTHLQKLNLAFNRFEFFDNMHDIQLSHLQELNLSHNQINSFPNKIYQWISLIKLDLSFNKLLSIPRFALDGLNNLIWLSLASNSKLNCVVQDSFKYLKSLKYLDLSHTNLLNLDACIFIQLIGLQSFSIELQSVNCTSCWLYIAKKKSPQIFGHCLDEKKIQRIDSLTDEQIKNACSQSSIDCTIDYCDPGSMKHHQQKVDTLFPLDTTPHLTKKRTIKLIFGTLFSIITLSIAIAFIILIIRRKQNKKILCCDLSQTTTTITTTTTTTTAEETRRRRQQIIDKNPGVIESVVTHGANMNVPSHPYENYAYCNDENSNNKRKLYNPMFADSPTSDIRQQQQSIMVSNDSTSQSSQLYSENLQQEITMTTPRHHLNTDHWSKMRMNVIKNAINTEQRGRVLSWEKHKQSAAQHELEAAIHGTRSLPQNNVGPVHNFQDVLKHELDTYVPGRAYFRRQSARSVDRINAKKNNMKKNDHSLTSNSQYTLLTLPTNPQSDQTRSRVPVLQCRGKI
ncbi:unnamed protein product [Rotaria socialis]